MAAWIISLHLVSGSAARGLKRGYWRRLGSWTSTRWRQHRPQTSACPPVAAWIQDLTPQQGPQTSAWPPATSLMDRRSFSRRLNPEIEAFLISDILWLLRVGQQRVRGQDLGALQAAIHRPASTPGRTASKSPSRGSMRWARPVGTGTARPAVALAQQAANGARLAWWWPEPPSGPRASPPRQRHAPLSALPYLSLPPCL